MQPRLNLISVTQALVPGDYFLQAFSRKDVFATVSHLSKYFRQVTAKYRLSLVIQKLENFANEKEIKLEDTSHLSLDDKFKKLVEECHSQELILSGAFLYPLYLKNLFPESIKNLLKSNSVIETCKAYERIEGGSTTTNFSIESFLQKGADVNAIIDERTLLSSAFSRNQTNALEEILSHPEKTITALELNESGAFNYHSLEHVQALLLKGATPLSILKLFKHGNWFVRNISSPENMLAFFEFCFPLLKDNDSINIFLEIIDGFQLIFSNGIDEQHIKIADLIFEIFSCMIKFTQNINLISKFGSTGHGFRTFLDNLRSSKNSALHFKFIKFISSNVNESSFEILSNLLNYCFKWYDYSLFAQRKESNPSSYLEFLKKNTFLRHVFLNSLPSNLKIQMQNMLDANENLQEDVFELFPDPAIIKDNLKFISPFNDVMLVTCFLRMLATQQELNSAFKIFTMFTSYFFEIELIGCFEELKKLGNAIIQNDDIISIFHGLISNENNLEAQGTLKIHISNELLIKEDFLAQIKKVYHNILDTKEEKEQLVIDNLFKGAKCFPDVDQLADQLDKLNKDFISKAINQEETTKLIAKINVFIEALRVYPRDPSFKFLNQTIYEQTKPAVLITKFGIIKEQRKLLEPIQEAAKQLTRRY